MASFNFGAAAAPTPGAAAAPSTPLFGGGGIFGGAATPTTGGNIFGGAAPGTAPATGGFGGGAPTTPSLFGPAPGTAPATGGFGGGAATPSLFGGVPQQQQQPQPQPQSQPQPQYPQSAPRRYDSLLDGDAARGDRYGRFAIDPDPRGPDASLVDPYYDRRGARGPASASRPFAPMLFRSSPSDRRGDPRGHDGGDPYAYSRGGGGGYYPEDPPYSGYHGDRGGATPGDGWGSRRRSAGRGGYNTAGGGQGYFSGGVGGGTLHTPSTRGLLFSGNTPSGASGGTARRVFGGRGSSAKGDGAGGDGASPKDDGHVGTPWSKGRRRSPRLHASAADAAHTPPQGVTADIGNDCWVTVFGFAPEKVTSALREFQRDGDVVFFDAFDDGEKASSAANWTHVRFATKEGARRALLRNGTMAGGSIVGVKPLDDATRAIVEARHGGVGLASGGGGGGSVVRPSGGAAASARPHRVAPTREGVSLQPRRSFWGKVVEFIFGM